MATSPRVKKIAKEMLAKKGMSKDNKVLAKVAIKNSPKRKKK